MSTQAEDTDELLARMERQLQGFAAACREEVSGVEQTLGQVRTGNPHMSNSCRYPLPIAGMRHSQPSPADAKC